MGQKDYEEGLRMIQEEFMVEAETEDRRKTWEKDQEINVQDCDELEITTQQKRSYAQIAEGRGEIGNRGIQGTREVIEDKGHEMEDREERRVEGEAADVLMELDDQEEKGSGRMMGDPREGKTAESKARDDKVDDTLQNLEAMQKRYDIFLKEQEEDKKSLVKLQEGMNEFKKQQDRILNIICRQEESQLNQSKEMKEMRKMMGEMQRSMRSRDKDTKNKEDMSDWDGGSYAEDL